MKIHLGGVWAVALIMVATSQARAETLPVYRGRILDNNTTRPMPGLIVEAQLQKEALPTGQRMVGRTKTDSTGRFVLQLSVARRDIALIASKKGSTSKVIDFGGQTSMMTDIKDPVAIETNPSERKENIIYSLVREQKKK